jgi:hypothetical protein
MPIDISAAMSCGLPRHFYMVGSVANKQRLSRHIRADFEHQAEICFNGALGVLPVSMRLSIIEKLRKNSYMHSIDMCNIRKIALQDLALEIERSLKHRHE